MKNSSDKFDDFDPGRMHVWESQVLQGIEENLSSLHPLNNDWLVRCYSTVSSTMDVGHELLEDVSPGRPGLVLAKEQTKGRGRQGRSWESAATGFYATYCFAVPDNVQNIFSFPLVVACALAEMFESFGLKVCVKWPNDILSREGEKLSGILVELVQEKGFYYVLVGVGVNLLGEPKNLQSTSLFSLTGRQFSPPHIAVELSERLALSLARLEENGFIYFKENWLERAWHLNEKLTVHVSDELITGTFRGLNDLGHLLLEIDGEVKEISSGIVMGGGVNVADS
ncbi:MAG: biotin--[acetyl-CoA-carboxylase] ligase [Deltaproteobacteria bacterium]|nr:biotin--[acetyl-CoA-carboxylase] ligase [Deltaproteobacteria bacterium]